MISATFRGLWRHNTERSVIGSHIQLHLVRGAAAAALLAGAFAVFFFVLLPGSNGDGSVLPARMLDTPASSADASEGVHRGDLARNFEASDLDDLRMTLGELRGRPVVINFWATWCTSCVVEMPVLEQQRLAHEEDDLAIVAVNVGEGTGDAREFIESLGLFDFVLAMDPDLTISDAYSVRGMPHSLFIDREGVIRAEYRGQLDEATMDSYVQAAIDAVPGVDAPTTVRFVQTVPREHVLVAAKDDVARGMVTFLSRRFRCDDDYCAEPLVALIEGLDGVLTVDLRSDIPEPALVLQYDSDAFEFNEIVDSVADAVRAFEDPLYSRELEVRIAE